MSQPASPKRDLFDADSLSFPEGYPSARMEKLVKRRRLAFFSLCTIFVYFAYSYYGASHYMTLQSDTPTRTSRWGADADPEAVWEKIKPGTIGDLPWTACYEELTPSRFCAKLTVPLDYANPEGESAIIALIKVPAAVSPTDKAYKGPILFNPGGPGGSGVEIIQKMGDLFQQFIGSEFDIVGFDPRGVARTRPQIVIFPDEAERANFHLQYRSLPLWNTSIDAASRMYATSKIIGGLADARESVKHAAAHVSTALVARDMLSITRAFGREKLQYWGFSYGTILGATFAAMFPDKVERLIIDGVVDADDYYNTTWKKNLLDTDKEFLLILQACVDAGPEKCALYEPSATQVHARLTAILENLKRNPVAVMTNSSAGPSTDYGIVDYKWAQTILFLFLYSPYGGFAPILFSAFRALEDGKGEQLWTFLSVLQPPLPCSCKPGTPTIQTPEALIAIACSDGLPVNDTAEEVEKSLYELSRQSEFGTVVAMRGSCAGWKVRPVERFAGPWMAHTSHPLLVIGNTLDPVTPLVNAHTMSTGFAGSVVLTQESAGHCSLAAPSLCTAKAVRKYFKDGTLPTEGTVCHTKGSIFGGVSGDALEGLAGEDLTIMEAWGTLSEMFPTVRRGLPLSILGGI